MLSRVRPRTTITVARKIVTERRGSALASTPTAVASVGATAAPSTHAGPHGIPRACETTAAAAAETSTVLASTIPRRLLRISRNDAARG